jgi:hypothetical protein
VENKEEEVSFEDINEAGIRGNTSIDDQKELLRIDVVDQHDDNAKLVMDRTLQSVDESASSSSRSSGLPLSPFVSPTRIQQQQPRRPPSRRATLISTRAAALSIRRAVCCLGGCFGIRTSGAREIGRGCRLHPATASATGRVC